MDFYVPLFLILPFLLKRSSGSSGSSGTSKPVSNFPDVAKVENIEFAKGSSNPVWPLISKHPRSNEVPYKKTNGKYVGNAARSFGFPRSDGKRRHVGIDLYSYADDVVVASESGTVIATQGFLDNTKAMIIQGNSGLVTLYGEIENNSWEEFDIDQGSKVKAGQPIARVGVNDAGTFMLHFETYKEGTKKNITFPMGTKPDPRILNPTKYLLSAQKNLNS